MDIVGRCFVCFVILDFEVECYFVVLDCWMMNVMFIIRLFFSVVFLKI